MDWIDFDKSKFHHQKLPKERRYLLVQVAEKTAEGLPPAVAVGYLKFAAGCKDSPYFVLPGVGGDAVAWCDCLGDDFMAPLWPGTHKRPNAELRRSSPRTIGWTTEGKGYAFIRFSETLWTCNHIVRKDADN